MQKSNDKSSSSISLILMIAISLITQVATLMKSSIVAGIFGATDAMDAYNFANSIFSFIIGIIISGIPTVILPAYVQKRDRHGIDSFITLLYTVLFLTIAVILLFRYKIVYTFTNRNEIFVNVTCNIMLIVALFQYLSSFTGITVVYFQYAEKFLTPKIINLLSQIIVLISLIFSKDLNIYTYTALISLGILLNFIFDTGFALYNGWRFFPSFNFKNETSKNLLHIFLPVMFSSSIYKLSLFIDSMIASGLDEGKLTILSYSNTIVSMVDSLIIGNMLIYIYPKLIKKINKESNQDYFWEQTNFYHMIVCLLIAGFFSVGKEAIALLFQRGLFTAEITKSVFLGTLIYIFGNQFTIIRNMVYRYFYCISDTKTPTKNSLLVSIVNIVISLILVRFVGFYGIILGTVIASVISVVCILIRFNKAINLPKNFRSTVFEYIKNNISMLMTVLIIFVSKKLLITDSHILSVLVFGMETIVVYAIITFFVNRKALQSLK